MKKGIIFSLFTILFFAAPVLNASQHEAEFFFNQYIQLGNNFDSSISNLYSDNAVVHTKRTGPDGKVQELKMTGMQWKDLIQKAMPAAKSRGDVSKYSNVKYSTDGHKVKIKADRYSVLKCYSDIGYYMVVEKQGDEFKIIEEYSESQVASSCKEVKVDGLTDLMRLTKKQLDPHLPIEIDDDTRLDSVNIKENTFEYQYTLVTVDLQADAIDKDSFNQTMQPIVVQQSCTMPNLRPLIDQGAVISYVYNDKNGNVVTEISVDKGSCK